MAPEWFLQNVSLGDGMVWDLSEILRANKTSVEASAAL
jgi:hypothetical protein